ncbi:MAG: class II D-tagatose-bisphosphate aldolase, non-catalytic subunit [Desulfobacterales bacterium]|nr:class II D-tagatose-bisphosphate aldolase, non-catalytic subunit [Desulfobacterales bacterium]
MDDPLIRLKERHLAGTAGGQFAVCSAHPVVLGCAMEMVRTTGRCLLVEATANQVNPFGGYSGHTPAQFMAFVEELAGREGLPPGRVVVGADHLGPHVWKAEPAQSALGKAETLARQCVAAGFQKLHLDTATACADDPAPQLPVAEAARRAARLCRAAEAARADQDHGPLYVIGKEVPPPGGALAAGEAPAVSDPEHILADLTVYRRAFEAAGVAAAWSRVMAVVVQPGVDFGDHGAAAYAPERAAALSAAHGQLPGPMTYEVHATDYQTPEALQRMVQDHFILLKVGPCLTFALRRALYALAEIEAELDGIAAPSRLPEVMEGLMTERPEHWRSHYRGDEACLRHLRHHSPRDRIRYYWSDARAAQAVARLLGNLGRPLPSALLEAKLPELFAEIRHEKVFADPSAIVRCAVRHALRPYIAACR